MKILVSGSTGMVGSALIPLLEDEGHEVARLVRSKVIDSDHTLFWDPASGMIESDGLEGFDAIVHLAGENINGRWTPDKMRRIRESRGGTTGLLCGALAGLEAPPGVLVSASAVGYYGDRGDEVLDEGSGPGTGFFSEVVRDWEEATSPAVESGIRVVNLRFGVILSPTGGMLGELLRQFRAGLGGKVGSGRQYVSWVGIDDAVAAIRHVLTTEDLRGPVVVAAPNPVTHRHYRVLRRPALFTLPAFMARFIFGDLADELLLSSTRVDSRLLQESGFVFRHTRLEEALNHLLSGDTRDWLTE